MKNLVTMIIVLAAAGQLTFGQKAVPMGKTDDDPVNEIRREIASETRVVSSALTAADVGDPDSFGKTAKFLGTASSGAIVIYSSCDPAVLLNDLGITLGATDRCVAADPSTITTATLTDLGRINIPARSVANVIYPIANHTLSWDFYNPLATTSHGQMSYSPRMTIISTALNDPAAVDPNTGLPLNGSLTLSGFGSRFYSRTFTGPLDDSFAESYSRATTRGFARSFFADLGLPQSVINNLYNSPMTIRLDARVSVRQIGYGEIGYSARFLGN